MLDRGYVTLNGERVSNSMRRAVTTLKARYQEMQERQQALHSQRLTELGLDEELLRLLVIPNASTDEESGKE